MTFPAGDGGAGSQSFAQFYDSQGAPQGAPIALADGELPPLPSGGFAVLKKSSSSNGGNTLSVQLLLGDGTPVGDPVVLGPLSAGASLAGEARLAVRPDGSLVVVYSAPPSANNSGSSILGEIVLPPASLGVIGSGVAAVTGTAGDDAFLAAPGSLRSGDQIDGAGDTNTLQLTSPGTLDLASATSIANVQIIKGSSGDDTFILDNAVLSGVTAIDGGGGINLILASGSLDLTHVALTNIQGLSVGSAPNATITVSDAATASLVSSQGANTTVIITAGVPSSARLAQIFAQGVATVVDANGRIYAANGTALAPSPEFSTDIPGSGENMPALAGFPDGTFVLTWTADRGDGNGATVFAQRYAGDGTPLGGPLKVNTSLLMDSVLPSVASLSGGGFVVAWSSEAGAFLLNNPGATAIGIFAQRYDARGNAVGGEVRVNPQGEGLTGGTKVLGLANGGDLVAWSASGHSGVTYYGQLYGADGSPRGSELALGDGPNGLFATPDGGFIAAGSTPFAGDTGTVLIVDRFAADGSPVAGSHAAVTLEQSGWDTAISVAALTTFVAGPGVQTLVGNGGGDTFILQPGIGHVVIENFAAGSGASHDVARLDRFNIATVSQILSALQQNGSDATLALSSDDSVTFRNTSLAQLTAADFVITTVRDELPVVTAHNVTISSNVPGALSSFISARDPDGDPILQYKITDESAAHASFSPPPTFSANGVVASAAQPITLTAAQFAQTTFQLASGFENFLDISAFDGANWSEPMTVEVTATNPPAEQPPVLNAGASTFAAGAVVPVAALFSVASASTITAYRITNQTTAAGGGTLFVNGLPQPAGQPAGQSIDIAADQLRNVTLQNGTIATTLSIAASDGIAFGNAVCVIATPPVPPTVTASDVRRPIGWSEKFSDFVKASDIDGDTITEYSITENTSGANTADLIVNDTTVRPTQPLLVSAAAFAGIEFENGSVTTSFTVSAFDGTSWSAPASFKVIADSAPSISAADQSLPRGAVVPVSTLFAANDPDGDAITQYQI
ncbi:MAG TPA: hypothetical protein VFA50_09315 [Stellaceae bacterium]|nr:hypothetical protein [Stellaceae bacterium]